EWRQGGKAARKRKCLFHHARVGDRFAGEANTEGFAALNKVAGHTQPHCVKLPDRSYQALCSAGSRHDADANLRLPEARLLADDDNVGMHRQLQPATDRYAADRCDYRLGKARKSIPQALEMTE